MGLDAQKKFMSACGQTITTVNYRQIELYKELIREEVVQELFPSLETWLLNPLDKIALKEVLDAIGDAQVTLMGLALSMGSRPEVIKDRVDASNLTKIPIGSNKVLKRADGKILKPDSFVLPNLEDLVDEIIDKITGQN